MNSIDIHVRFTGGAYNTGRVGKLSSSSTSSAEFAARRLAEKVFGPSLLHVDQIVSEKNGTSVWQAVADTDLKAWCWATGLIEFGHEVPQDAIQFAAGPDRALRQVVDVAARHGQGNSSGELLVPGIPEAKNQREGLLNLGLWVNDWARGNGNSTRFGVVFRRDFEAAL